MAFRLDIIVTGLGPGGAEAMLAKVLGRIDRRLFAPRVLALTGIDTLVERFRAIEVPVEFFGMRRGLPAPGPLLRLYACLRRHRPHLVQTWMYHADLVGGLAAKLAGPFPVIWNIRHSNLDPRFNKRSTLWTVRACARLSRRLPERIVCCAEEAKRAHAQLGYAPERLVVIPNGFDLEAFRPDRGARADLRAELQLPPGAFLIGLVARHDRLKDHGNFIAAAARFRHLCPDARFVLCGEGITWENPALARPIAEAGLADAFRLLGRRGDVARITAALDLATSSSCGEGFSNTIGEAMACGVPCVVTDVGDSALIVGATGRVVPPRDPAALCAGWQELAALPAAEREQLGAQARARITGNFSLDTIVHHYQALYLDVLARSAPPPA